jgi:mannose-6-phosphate isomerase
LNPGQAVFIPAGLVHSYLEGAALELMAGSDNVIRGGLTQKHTDIEEFLKTASFRSHRVKISMPVKNRNEYYYITPAGEFALSKIIVDGGIKYFSPKRRNAEIILCTEGRAVITGPENEKINLSSGKSVIVPASIKRYSIDGKASLYKAQTPL